MEAAFPYYVQRSDIVLILFLNNKKASPHPKYFGIKSLDCVDI